MGFCFPSAAATAINSKSPTKFLLIPTSSSSLPHLLLTFAPYWFPMANYVQRFCLPVSLCSKYSTRLLKVLIVLFLLLFVACSVPPVIATLLVTSSSYKIFTGIMALELKSHKTRKHIHLLPPPEMKSGVATLPSITGALHPNTLTFTSSTHPPPPRPPPPHRRRCPGAAQ